jgi:hypothetical protein
MATWLRNMTPPKWGCLVCGTLVVGTVLSAIVAIAILEYRDAGMRTTAAKHAMDLAGASPAARKLIGLPMKYTVDGIDPAPWDNDPPDVFGTLVKVTGPLGSGQIEAYARKRAGILHYEEIRMSVNGYKGYVWFGDEQPGDLVRVESTGALGLAESTGIPETHDLIRKVDP